MRDLHAELNGVAPSDPRQLKAVEQQALQIMINRKLLAKAASDYASQLLHQQRIQQAVTRKMQGVIAQGAAKVSYNPAYRPAAPAKATPPAKGG